LFLVLFAFWFNSNLTKNTLISFQLAKLGLIGILSGFLFLLKPNLVSIPFSILIFLGFSYYFRREEGFESFGKKIIILITGTIFPILIFSVYFFLKGSFFDFYEAVITYNLLYSSSSPITTKLFSILNGLNFIYSLFIIAFAGWCLWIVSVLLNKNQKDKRFSLLFIVSISLPIEILLTGFSGRGYGHYFMSWLPICAILATYFIYELMENLGGKFQISLYNKISNIKPFIILTLILALFIVPSVSMIGSNIIAFSKLPQKDTCLDIIENQTSTQDYVLMWGAETKYNFLTGRKSPTKYTYQYPILNVGYNQPEKMRFISEVKKNRPMLIIDTSATNDIIPPLNKTKRDEWSNINNNQYDEIFENFFNYIEVNYKMITKLNESRWDPTIRIKNCKIGNYSTARSLYVGLET